MKNTTPSPRRCYLSMFWKTRDTEVGMHYETAHLIMDALIKGGKTEAEAKVAVEYLWNKGRTQGYDDARYDCQDN